MEMSASTSTFCLGLSGSLMRSGADFAAGALVDPMNFATPIARPEDKLLGLEVLRFVTALAILIWHYQHFAFSGLAAVNFIPDRQPFYGLFSLFFQQGLRGVQVFWCISGFIFFYKYRDTLSERKLDGPTFFVLRFSRLYPLHLATLLLVVGLQGLYVGSHGQSFVYENNDLKHFILQIFMASFWGLQKGYSFNGPIWSISIEILIYVIFFVGLRLFGRSIWFNIAMVGLYPVARVLGVYNVFILAVSYFYAGGLAAIFRSHLVGHRLWPQVQAGVLTCLIGGLAAAAGLHVLNDKPMINDALLILTPLMLVLVSGQWPVSSLIAGIIQGLGNLTYASYLLHFPLQLAAVLVFSALGLAIPLYDNLFFLGYFAGVLGASYLVFRVFERPAQAAIRKALLT